MNLNSPHNLTPRHLLTATIICVLACLALLWAADASAQDRPLKAAIASYAALSVLDARQTGACLGAGTCREMNPALRPMPTGALLTVKLAANAGVAVTVWKLRRTRPKTALGLAIAAAVSQGVVVAHNARRRR
jgi:hypothetical protein